MNPSIFSERCTHHIHYDASCLPKMDTERSPVLYSRPGLTYAASVVKLSCTCADLDRIKPDVLVSARCSGCSVVSLFLSACSRENYLQHGCYQEEDDGYEAGEGERLR